MSAPLRMRIEHVFERLARWLIRYRFPVLLISFTLTGFLTWKMLSVKVDTSSESLLKKDDPALVAYTDFLNQFGRAEVTAIAVKTKDVFAPEFLMRLKALHAELEREVPFVEEIYSLVNARRTRGEGDTLIVEKLLETWPEEPLDLPSIKREILKNPFYLNNLISEDGMVTAVVIESVAFVEEQPSSIQDLASGFEDTGTGKPSPETHRFSEKENRELVEAVNCVVERYKRPGFEIAVAGSPVILDVFNHFTRSDMLRCSAISLIAIILLLTILFRRLSGVILPFVVIIASMNATIGLMSLFGVSIKLTTTVLPAFLLSTGVADSVHILTIFYRMLDQGYKKNDAIIYAMGHSGLPVVMTSLTTIAGLITFATAALAALGEMGIYASMGVALALIFTIVLLPAMLAVVPIKPRLVRDKKTLVTDRMFIGMTNLAVDHPAKIVLISTLVFVASIAGMFLLRYSDNVVSYFPDRLPIKADVDFIGAKLKGLVNLEMVVDTGRENGVQDPEILNTIEAVAKETAAYRTSDIFVGNVISINDILKEIHQALNENDPGFYVIPQDHATVAQEFLLFENSGADDLERIVDSQFSKTRITIKTPFVDSVIFNVFVQEMKARFEKAFQDKARITPTGLTTIFARTIPATLYSTPKSYALSVAIISIMMIFLIGNLRLGAISMFPNLLPIALVLGAIGFLDIPLDMTSMMIGNIAIGLVVDDTMHFIYNFQKYFALTGNVRESIQETLLGTGRAMVITSLTLCSGFFSCLFATLLHMQRFGLLLGLTIIAALIADLILTPACMALAFRKKEVLKSADARMIRTESD